MSERYLRDLEDTIQKISAAVRPLINKALVEELLAWEGPEFRSAARPDGHSTKDGDK